MFCKYCGKKLPDNSVFCSQCGKQISLGNSQNSNTEFKAAEIQSVRPVNTSLFEPARENQSRYIPTESSKSRLVAALLAFFLGEFGAHRFYVGKKASGFFQLILGLSFLIALICAALDGLELAFVFFVVGVAWSLWLIIDFITILCGSFKDKDGLPLTDWE